MKCIYCGKEFSDKVLPVHQSQCEVKQVEKKIEKKEEKKEVK